MNNGKFDQNLANRLIELIGTPLPINRACLAVNISNRTFWTWMGRPEPEYVDFACRVNAARAGWQEPIVKQIKEAVQADWRAGLALLARLDPDNWGSKPRQEQKEETSDLDLSQLNDEELKALHAIVSKCKPQRS